MASFAFVVLAIYVGIAALLFVFQRNLLYFPDSEKPSRAQYGVGEMEEVVLTTDDGLELFSWYQAADEGRPTIVFFHGNAGSVGSRGFKVQPYLRQGIGVLLLEYRGYGGNPGRPDEQGLYHDARAALSFLASRGVGSKSIVLYGESLGSGVAVQMAFEGQGGAIILETPYTSMSDVARHHYFWLPVQWLVRDRFESKKKIGRVSLPLLVLHGVDDGTVPFKFGKALFELAQEPKTLSVFEGGGHNNLYEYGAAQSVVEFLDGEFPRL